MSADPDVPRLLGLTGPGTWALVGLFWATYTLLIALSGGDPMRTPEGWVAFIATLIAAVVVVLPGPYPQRLPVVVAILAVVAFSTVAVVWNLSPLGWPGWTSWSFGSNTFLMFMLALRGRPAWGTAGMLLMTALTVHWTWSTTGDIWHGLDLTYRQVATYFGGTFFASVLRRTARRIVRYHAAEQRRIRDEHARESAERERDRQLGRVRRLAGRALEDISRRRSDDEQRLEHELLEAELRDGIRGRALADDERIAAAARAVRRRGGQVALLDDLPREPATAPDLSAIQGARDWVAARMSSIDVADVTVRIALLDGTPTVTLATGSGRAEEFSSAATARRAGRDRRA